jgi:hypothetical protein
VGMDTTDTVPERTGSATSAATLTIDVRIR